MGGVAYRFGRWKVAMISMIVLGISCTMVGVEIISFLQGKFSSKSKIKLTYGE